jgi:hypothetical protein
VLRHVAADQRGILPAPFDQSAVDVALPRLRAVGLGVAEKNETAHGR